MEKTCPILIVEDDAIAQMTLKQYLQKLGFGEALVTDDGSKALDILAERPEVGLVLLDIMINGEIDGIETARRIMGQHSVPVVFASALSDKKTLDRALATKPDGFVNKPYDISSLKDEIDTAQKRFRARETQKTFESDFMIDLIYDTADIGMCVTDENACFVRVNRAYCRTYGYKESELVGQPFVMVLPEETREYALDLHYRYVRGLTEESAGEWKIQTKSGEIKDIYVTAGRMTNKQGQNFKVTTVTDITEQKRHMRELREAVEAKETLVREVHHRVKNNLNIISGLLFLQSEKVAEDPSVHRMFVESMNRIKTLSFIHEKLYQRDDLTRVDMKEYLEQLTESLTSSFAKEAIRYEVEVAVDPLTLDMDQAIPCGLIVNELLSNSFKYAFEGRDEGAVYVRLESKEGGRCALEIGDDGVGLPEGFDTKSTDTLGMQLIHNLSRQLGGTAELRSEEGTRFRVEFALH